MTVGFLLLVAVLVVAGIVLLALVARRAPGPRPGWASSLDTLRPEVVRLLHQGRPVEAVKAVRVATRLGLADAKRLVDQVAAEEGIDPRVRRRR